MPKWVDPFHSKFPPTINVILVLYLRLVRLGNMGQEKDAFGYQLVALYATNLSDRKQVNRSSLHGQ